MKTITLALWLAASAYGVALASESRHAVIVDMPKVINLNHASPDTWHTLPPVPSKDVPTTTAALLFAQVGPVESTCEGKPRRPISKQALSRGVLLALRSSLGTIKEEVH
jgi:hypothetical protein